MYFTVHIHKKNYIYITIDNIYLVYIIVPKDVTSEKNNTLTNHDLR